MSTEARRFLFAVCQHGAERWLKAEVEALGLGFVPAFQRPGLVTFRGPTTVDPGLRLELTFARVYGASLGAAASPAEVGERALPEDVRLHVFPRDPVPPGDAADRLPGWDLAEAVERELRAGAGRFLAPSPPVPGELVLDVVVAAGEPLWLGLHRHDETRHPAPGGRPRLVLPAEAPSRAYLKMVEALDWSGLRLRRDAAAIELGAAPGGAVHALLERGLSVVAVDPRRLDPRVAAHPRCRHLKRRIEALTPADVPRQVQLLAMDVGTAPQFALHHLAHVVAWAPRLEALVLTLKLNEPRFAAELPAFADKVRAMGFPSVRLRQLGSNRREVCLVARR